MGSETRVIYRNAKPTELEHSERVVLKGKMNGDVFECKEILLKCPSKYKDDPKRQQKSLEEAAAQPAEATESKP
jgi:cytochrome c-type biogenesis protein CcmE